MPTRLLRQILGALLTALLLVPLPTVAGPEPVDGDALLRLASGYSHVEAWIWTHPDSWVGHTLSWTNACNDCAIAAFGIGSDSSGIVSLSSPSPKGSATSAGAGSPTGR